MSWPSRAKRSTIMYAWFPQQAWALIRASTGIADPDLFIQKHLNCDHLETQMMELKQASDVLYRTQGQEVERTCCVGKSSAVGFPTAYKVQTASYVAG